MASKSNERTTSVPEESASAVPAPAVAPAVAPKASPPGVRLESYGKGVSYADVHERTRQVVIRRSGRIIERLPYDASIHKFATDHNLSQLDRETLSEVGAVRGLDAAKRQARFATLGPDAKLEFPNTVSLDKKDGHFFLDRIREQVEQNDKEVFAWVERQRLARQSDRPSNVQEMQTFAAALQARSSEPDPKKPIEQSSPLFDRNLRVPAEVESQYNRAGEKFYHLTGTKAVAFVDRGDRLETPSSAPKLAEALVKIAEGRDWNELRVQGTEGFRREVWIEASVRGIHVDGFKPSEQDKAELEKRHTLMQSRNAIEVRSDAFKKLPPEAGVRVDPGLAAAYASEAAAKRFAARLPAENREAFVLSVKEAVAQKLDNGERLAVKLKVPEGRLIEHGAANFKFDENEKPSYYVKLSEASGRERVYWGAGLQQAMSAAAAQPGDTVQLRVTESRNVVVQGNARGAAGLVIGRQQMDAQRNEWQATVTAPMRAKTQERQQPEQARSR